MSRLQKLPQFKQGLTEKPKGRALAVRRFEENMSSKKQWTTGLPDTSKWLPRKLVRQTLTRAFLKRCKDIEKSILQRSRSEREMNIDNYDSGSGLEDIVREELSELFPSTSSPCEMGPVKRLGRLML